MSPCIDAKGHPKRLTSILLFPTDIADTRSWEQENAQTQADESSPSALQRAAWGISETESELTYGEVEHRLDLLQEQLNRYKQRQGKGRASPRPLVGSRLSPCNLQIPTTIISYFFAYAYLFKIRLKVDRIINLCCKEHLFRNFMLLAT